MKFESNWCNDFHWKVILKISSTKYRPFCLGFNLLTPSDHRFWTSNTFSKGLAVVRDMIKYVVWPVNTITLTTLLLQFNNKTSLLETRETGDIRFVIVLGFDEHSVWHMVDVGPLQKLNIHKLVLVLHYNDISKHSRWSQYWSGVHDINSSPQDKMAAILADDIFKCIFVNEKFFYFD